MLTQSEADTLFTEEKFVELELVNKIRHGLSPAPVSSKG